MNNYKIVNARFEDLNKMCDLWNEVYEKMTNFSHDQYKEMGVASLTTRISTDAFVLMQFADQILRMGIMAPLMTITTIIMMLKIPK